MADMQKPADTENDAAAMNEQSDAVDEILNAVRNGAKASETTEKTTKQETSAAAERKKRKSVEKPASAEEIADDNEYDDEDDEDFFAVERRKRMQRRKRRRLRRRRKKGRGISCALITMTFIISAAVLFSVTILAIAKELYGIDKDIEKKRVVVANGATVTEIADQLLNEKLIRLPKLFRVISRLSGTDASYIAGEHELAPNMSYEAMIEELCTNHERDREYVKVTFREGINLLDAAKLLEESEVCPANKFLFYFNAGGYGFKFEDYIPQNDPLRFQNREGYCFPDTYEFYVGEDPEYVVQKIYANFDQKITSADYKAMDEMGMTLDEVITLASVVQGEAPSFEDMKLVSSVFHNRLNNPGKFSMLQSDPTRKYAEEVIAPYLAMEQRQDQLMCNEYNTYVGQGLPPGAINNPGKEAITAVLYPESSNYYYFAANVNTGVTYYAVDYDEHKRNLEMIKQQSAEAALADNGNE